MERFSAAGGQNALVTYSQTMATLLWTVILAGRLVSAVMVRKVPQKRLIMLDSIGVAVFFTLLLLGDSIIVVTLAIMGLGFCIASICPMIYSDASYITNRYPMGTSVLLALGAVGAMIMLPLVGVVSDAYGFTGGMSVILFGVAALLVLSILNAVLKPVRIQQNNQ